MQFKHLREANIKRLPLFKNSKGEPAHTMSDGSDWNLGDWHVAVVGEVGELFNFLKKYRRGDMTVDVVRDDIAKEIADVVIYLDIYAYQLRDDISMSDVKSFDDVVPQSMDYTTLNQMASNITQRNIPHLRLPGHRHGILQVLKAIAKHFEIDITQAVVSKFNETSRKIGVEVYIDGPDESVLVKNYCQSYLDWCEKIDNEELHSTVLLTRDELLKAFPDHPLAVQARWLSSAPSDMSVKRDHDMLVFDVMGIPYYRNY